MKTTGGRGRRWIAAGVITAAAVVLFFAYLGLSRSYPENSDEANLLLMAQDMVNGNLLLHDWYVSDVSFITYELPQLALLERVFGWGFSTAHISAALTFTLVVVIGALLARGSRREVDGKTGLVRMALAAGVMFAPQTGVAVFVLILSIGHIGTAVPVMLAWLIADRLGQRWYVPVCVTLLLAWALAGDPLVLVIAVWPLMVVGVLRLIIWLARGDGSFASRVRRIGAARWFELSLVAAGAAAWLLSRWVTSMVSGDSGYTLNPLPYTVQHPAGQWWGQARAAWNGLRAMFGMDVAGQHAVGVGLAWLHVAGLVLAGLGLLIAARRFLSWPGDLVSQLLLVAIVANLAAYIPSTLATYGASNVREIAPVLPFGAVLAGRELGGYLVKYAPRVRFAVPVLGLVLVGYAWTLAAGAFQPAAQAPYADLAAFLEQHHLTEGLGGYWQASVITVETQGQVTIRALTSCSGVEYPAKPGTTLFGAARDCFNASAGQTSGSGCEITPYPWETNASWYDATRNSADFLVADHDPAKYSFDPRGPFNLVGGALILLGKEKDLTRQPYYIGRAGSLPYPPYRATYEVRVYKYNLLPKLPALAAPQACS